MDITITKKNIYDYVLALTARAGKALGAYEEIAVTEDNFPMLDVYLSAAVVYAEGVFRKKLSASNEFDLKANGESLYISFRSLNNLNESVKNLVASSIRLGLAHHIAAAWLLMTPGKEFHAWCMEMSLQYFKEAYDALNQRKLPTLNDGDYSLRKNDNVLSRPGIRITDKELLTIRSGENCDTMEPASDSNRHVLISKS